MINIMLIGLGQHATHHHFKLLNLLEEHSLAQCRMVVDIASARDRVQDHLQKHGRKEVEVLYVPDEERDDQVLSARTAARLNEAADRLGIRHVIISTEVKAHEAYIRWAVQEGMHFLTDKPIFSETYDEVRDLGHSNLYARFQEINHKITAAGINAAVVIPRRMNPPFLMMRSYLSEFVRTFGVPATHFNYYHGEGMWNMPDEFYSRENHPYKYGYGALFHTAYHFIDLIDYFMSVNDQLCENRCDAADLAISIVNPSDVCRMVGEKAYEDLIGVHSLHQYMENMGSMGEVDLQMLINLYASDALAATCNLDIRQSDYSARKSRILPEDLFRGNGRIYHELLEIEVPHLLKIHLVRMTIGDQKSRADYAHKEEDFVVQIYRNANITGGKAFEEIIFPYDSEMTILGKPVRMDLGDASRYNIMRDWLFNQSRHTSFASHQRSMQLFDAVQTLTAKLHNTGRHMGCDRVPLDW